MFDRIKALFATPAPKSSWVTFDRGYMKVDIIGFLKTPEGQKCLADEKAFTQKLIDNGDIIDLT